LITDPPPGEPLQRLSLSLQGVIDAAVNGGVAKYREAFLSGDSEVNDEGPEGPTSGSEAGRLKTLMVQQVRLV